MTDAIVVIGAGYGDEGKGRTVDYYAKKYDKHRVLGVRFNGGAQASHTVLIAKKERHAFSHFSSVTARGFPTFLDKEFILNPFAFKEEWMELVDKGFTPPTVYVHPECRVTTCWDMITNQEEEKNRDQRHGSCGMGIHNTVVRSKSGNVGSFRIKHLDTVRAQTTFFNSVMSYWRGKFDVELENRFIEEMQFMLDRIKIIPSEYVYSFFDLVIFEGAQGLQLDEDSKNFPHVTHSKTGLHNIQESLNKYFDKINVNYVTRCYQTKHGAGPFEYEQDLKEWFSVIDQTNIPNDWQGQLRFAPIDTSKLFHAIMEDIISYPLNKARYRLNVTCLDQAMKNDIPIIGFDDNLKVINKKEFMIEIDVTCATLGFKETRFYDKAWN